MKNKNENREHCKAIAERLEAIAENLLYCCPECGEWIEWNNDQYNDENATYTCQECHATFEENELDFVSFYDYFENCLDVNWILDSNREYRACRIMIACGGPNIYVNTWDKQVELYWWTESATYPLDYKTVNALDEWAEEWYKC